MNRRHLDSAAGGMEAMNFKTLNKRHFKFRRAEASPQHASTPEQQGHPYARPESPANAVGSDHKTLYEPLEVSKHQIRMLKVNQLDFDEDGFTSLHCSLVVTSLDDNSEYDALSYTWGDPDDLENIYVNSHVFPVRRNLFDALCTLKQSGNLQGHIWADAVCINQEDINERNQQVQMMTRIYTQAQTVRIWLGLDIPGVETFFAIAASGRIIESLISTSANNDGSQDGYWHVVSRQWWRRLWVVQEAVLARHAIAHCGNNTILWTNLRESLLETSKEFASLTYTTAQLQTIGLQHLVRSSEDIEPFEPWIDRIKGPRDLSRVVHLIKTLSTRNMADGKDLIYGALGLLPEDIRVNVDYNLSLQEVFQKFAERIMQWTGSLQLLSECQYPVHDESCPSWVPNFQQITIVPLLPQYNPSLDAPYLVPARRGNGLIVRAHIFDKVAFKGRSSLLGAGFNSSKRKQDMIHLRTVLKDWLDLMSTHQSGMKPKNRDTRFWNVIFQSVSPTAIRLDNSEISRSGESIISELQHWLDNTDVELTPSTEKHLILEGLSDLTFCRSKFGRPMLCRIEPDLDDCIAILPTCRTPLLLRPCSGEVEGAFKIVSSCLCEDVMYGEYIRTAAEIHVEKSPPHADELTRKLLNSVQQLHTVPNSFVDVMDQDHFVSVLAQIAADMATDLQSIESEFSQSDRLLSDYVLFSLTQLFKSICTEGNPTNAAAMIKDLIINEPDAAVGLRPLFPIALAFDKVMGKFEITHGSDPCNDKQLQEATEALALCVSIYAFEIILYFERSKLSYDGPILSERYTFLQQLAEDTFEHPIRRVASKKWYAALKHAALQELEIEKASTTLYEEIVLF